jgi:ubiquinone/menaquinone biosynthesis C-methylase UbiE
MSIATARSLTESENLDRQVGAVLRFEPDLAFRARSRTILEYIEPKAGQRVLDAGCGLGFTLYLLERLTACEVHGVDLDVDRLRESRNRRSDQRAVLAVADLGRLPYADHSFDAVIASEVLEHLEDDGRALVELYRVLRPGGVMAVTVPHANYPLTWDPPNFVRERLGMGHFSQGPLSGIWTDHRRLYSSDALRSLLEAAGFEVLDQRLHTRYSFPFSHQLIYTIGRAFVSMRAQGIGHRSDLWARASLPFWLTGLVGAFTGIDRLNRKSYGRGSAVTLCMKARRPGEARHD